MEVITPMQVFTHGRTRRLRLIAAVFGLSVCVAAPASAAGPIANPYDCAPQPTLAQNFAPWGDVNLYTPVPNAGFETGSAGWTLTGGAAVVAGNEPWRIGGASHRNALELPEGASAMTAPICIDETYPHFRLFVRSNAVLKGALRIEVVYLDVNGKVVDVKTTDVKTALPVWQPTGNVGINVFTSRTTVTAAPVAFRFTATGKGVRFQIDDVYVDPRMAR